MAEIALRINQIALSMPREDCIQRRLMILHFDILAAYLYRVQRALSARGIPASGWAEPGEEDQ
jgi:hypothetical protein